MKAGDLEAVKAIDKEHPDKESILLMEAVQENQIPIVTWLLDRGASPNTLGPGFGGTPLINAARWGYKDMVDLLLKRGAKIDNLSGDRENWTALAAATDGEHVDVVKLLLDKGADVKATDAQGRTPLMIAKFRKNAAIIALLKSHGAKK